DEKERPEPGGPGEAAPAALEQEEKEENPGEDLAQSETGEKRAAERVPAALERQHRDDRPRDRHQLEVAELQRDQQRERQPDERREQKRPPARAPPDEER